MLEKLRKEMHELIDKYGLDDERTVAKSQELDEVLNEIERLKKEAIYWLKAANETLKLLEEIEGFCPVLQRNEIAELLKKYKS